MTSPAQEHQDDLNLKERGNALYAQKKYKEALQAYEQALETLVVGKAKREGDQEEEEEGGEQDSQRHLRCTLLTNCAACRLQLKQLQGCVEDASEALSLDGSRVKALYRRAQAYEGLGDLEHALQDLRLVVHLDPANKDALHAARRVREATQKLQVETKSRPMTEMLVLLGKKEDSSHKSEREQTWKTLIGLVSEDSNVALELLRQGGLSLVWSKLSEPTTTGEANERLFALRFLAACSQHAIFVKEAFSLPGPPHGVAAVHLAVLQKLVGVGEDGESTHEETALVIIMIFYRWMKACGDNIHIVTCAIECGTAALADPQASVGKAWLDTLLWWSSESLEKNQELGLAVALSERPMACLLKFIDEESSSSSASQIKAAQYLGQLLANLCRSKGEGEVKALATELMETEQHLASSLEAMRRRAWVSLALFDADADLGCWALDQEANQVMIKSLLASSSAPTSQVLVAELLNKAASTEDGRTRVGAYAADEAFLHLIKAKGGAREARVAAASTFTKLGLAAKTLPSMSNETTDLLNIAIDGLQQNVASSVVPAAGVTTTTERAIEVLSCLVTRTALKQEMTYESGRCKACLPLLISMVQDKAAENASSSSSSGGGSSGGTWRAWYGVAFILASLTLSNDELHKEALRKKDITPEEYEQMHRIQEMQKKQMEAKQGTAVPGGGEVDLFDPPENVEGRVKELVRLKGIGALCRLAAMKGVGALSQEQVATAFVQIATIDELRGCLIQEGGYNACLEMAKEGTAELVRVKALHALAKCLVTTNPNILSDRQRMSPIVGLLWVCRFKDATNLQQFEALLALTNLASSGPTCVDTIVANRGIACIQSLQYSDHPLVRRSATEALCNMACHPQVVESLGNLEKLKIWLALADDYLGDLPTARAAAGTLAMASGDEGVAKAMAEKNAGGLSVLQALLKSGNPELIHRAAVAIRNMAGFEEPREAIVQEGLPQVLLSVLQSSESSDSTMPADVRSLLQVALEQSTRTEKMEATAESAAQIEIQGSK